MIPLLILFLALGQTLAKPAVHDPGIFEFTRPIYNLSISEKWDLTSTAWTTSNDRTGIFVPSGYENVKFKIVQGDDSSSFKTTAKKIGDFAFLIISLKPNEILNRELQDEYILTVKASARKKGEANYEAQAQVVITVVDDNDILPFFRDPEYTVDTTTKFSVNEKLIQLHAVDADIGLNGELLFSLQDPSEYFYVEPRSGWVRTFKPLEAGTYNLRCQVEDRASRLFYSKRTSFFNSNVNVTIKVREVSANAPKLNVQTVPLKYYTKEYQKAAVLSLSVQNTNLELSNEVLSKGDTLLERVSSTEYLLYQADVTNSIPPPVSLILRSKYPSTSVFTTEDITLQLDENRKVWFEGESEDETPRLKLRISDIEPVNSLVYAFKSLTTYEEDSNLIKYRIHGKESFKLPFHLEKSTGMLRLKSSLLSESQDFYEFSIVAKLEGVEGKAMIDVIVTIDVSNKKCPQFLNLPKDNRFVIKSPKTGQTLFSPKIDSKGEVNYKLVGSNGLVEVNPSNGEIILRKELGTRKDFTVKLMVLSIGHPIVLYSNVDLLFTTNASLPYKPSKTSDSCSSPNLNTPEFEESKEIKVLVTANVGEKIGQVKASDKDYGLNGVIRFTTQDSVFSVNRNTGEITVLRSLTHLMDFSEVYRHEIVIEASDLSLTERKKTSITVPILIRNQNLIAPKFEKKTYNLRIKEESLSGSELVRVKAVDSDFGQDGRVEYRLVSETEYASIDPDSGAFRLEKPLDRELQPQFTFPILAVDRGSPPKFAYANVTVTLEDVNDNSPKCIDLVHTVNVNEDVANNTLITCLPVFDADLGKNSELAFKVIDEIPLRIDSTSGCLFTKLTNPFDYEAPSYSFGITVTDKGEPPLSTVCQMKVNVVDVNENQLPPIFTESVYEASIKENVYDQITPLQIKAIDPEGKAVRYELIGGNGLGYFSINENTGEITAMKPLDAETTRTYSLTVKAEDVTSQPLSTVTHVVIQVEDVNDHAPVFSQPVYYSKIEENSDQHKIVLRINATDGDVTNNEITYSLEKGNVQSNFLLDQNTGFLVTGKRKLDRETQASHELYVKACDSSPSKQCSTVLVIVDVIDQNDNAPKFKHTALSLKVPAGRSGFLTRVFADDIDEDGPNSILTYNIEGNNNNFSIDQYGQLNASEPLKAGTMVTLTISAEDQGTPRLRSDVALTLTAVAPQKSKEENSPPTFKSPEKWRHLYTSDRDTVGTILGRVEVEDPDNDVLWFRITDTYWNPNATFAFAGNDGDVILARKINLIDPKLTTVELEVLATDGYVEIKEKIYIHVTRSTDVRPFFNESTVNIDLVDDFPVGYVIHQLKAHIDNFNHHIVYAIHSFSDLTVNDHIKIDPATGALLLEKRLLSNSDNNFVITVAAKINGGLETFCFVNVKRIFNTNHHPKCTSDIFKFFIDKNSELLGQQVGQVVAFDLDQGVNGQISYSIFDGNDDKSFDIDSENGKLTMLNEVKNRTLKIKVSDKGVNSKNVICLVEVYGRTTEEDIVVTTDSTQLTIETGEFTSRPISIIKSKSNDFTSFSQDSCPFIDVNFGNGLLFQNEFLGPSEVTKKSCSVFGENIKNEKVFSNVSVIVKDKKKSFFSLDKVNVYVSEDALIGSGVFSDVNLTKPWKLETEKIVKMKILTPRELYFGADIQKSTIYVKKTIDYSQYQTWSLLLGIQSEKSETKLIEVTVTVIKVNKRSPVFQVTKPFTLSLPAIKGTFIGQVKAIDPDNDTVKYGLWKASEFSSQFEIDLDSGVIKTKTSINKGTKTKAELELIATDGKHTSHHNVTIDFVEPKKELECTQEYFITAPENYNSTVPKPLLWIDWPQNYQPSEVFQFDLLTDSGFKLDRQSGLLSLTGTLDRETTTQVNLTIQISSENKPQRFCQSTVHVTVEDVNDCSPVFHHLPYEIFLTQDTKVNERLLSVKAKDDDSGAFGTVRYAVDGAPEFLEINKMDGKIKLKTKPTEKQLQIGKQFKFTVIASDQGNPPLTANADIVLYISDRNQPIFSHYRYATRISETSAPGTTIFNVQAKSNTNGTIAYVIQSGDDKKQFAIDFFKGKLMVNSELDREEKSEYLLEIKALDLSRKGISSSAFVKVTIDDVNDTPPEFDRQIYEFNVSENAVEGIILGSVHATDKDLLPTDNKISYAISQGPKKVITVDTNTGDIYLASKLNYDATNECMWILTATDSDAFSGETLVRLKVLDENNNPPAVTCPESLNVVTDDSDDQFLFQFKVIDNDLNVSLSNQISHLFKITDGDETLFLLEPRSAILRRIRKFSKEEEDELRNGKQLQYHLNVTASDGVHTTLCDLHVNFNASTKDLKTLNFDKMVSTVSVIETRLLSNRTTIKTIQADGGMKPYNFQAIVSEPQFNVQHNSANVILAKKVVKRSELLMTPFMVTDSIGNVAVQQFVVKVEESNQNSPNFVAPKNGYVLHLSSAAIEGDKIAKILAIDVDSDDQLEYAIVNNKKVNEILELDPKSGYLILKNAMSADRLKDMSFDVAVSDRNNPPHRSQANFNIHVVDGPVPQFSRLHYFFSISEDAHQGKVVGELMANQVMSVKVVYQIEDLQNDDDIPFVIETESGKLILRKQIDRETRSRYDFVVNVRDEHGRGSYAFVTVNVIDINDNAPEFMTNLHEISLPEDTKPGHTVFVFYAIDKDQGQNSKIIYELNDNKYFSIDKESGWLTLNDIGLDREAKEKHNLVIKARDEGEKSAEFKFGINVVDRNDNSPVFDQLKYKITLNRSTLKQNQTLVEFKINDNDTDVVQEMKVFITSEYLDIKENAVVLRKIPPVVVNDIKAKMTVFDGKYSSEAIFELTLIDDHKNVCEDVEENITIDKISSGYVVKNFEGDKIGVTRSYHLINAQNLPFQLQNNTKLLVKPGYLPGKYTLKIRSTEKMAHANSWACIDVIHVTINPTNMAPPQFFLQNYSIHYPENKKASETEMALIERLEAKDSDLEDYGTLKYFIVFNESSNDAESYFYLDENTGALMAKKTVDREKYSEFNLKVMVVDGGGLKDYTYVNIVIDDENDNEPQFEMPVYQLKVLENEAIGYELLKLVATDSDQNAQLIFSLQDPAALQYVTIDPLTGVIKLGKSFDYEQIQNLRFNVIVSDGELNSTATVEIEVLDVNDNSPRFSQPIVEVTVKENLPVGSNVVQVKASDHDSQHFGKLSFSLSGNDANLFLITDDGWIKTTTPLDYESKQMYRLNVKAVDGGTPALSDDCLVTIIVSDVNDNAPEFDMCNMSAVIQEGVEAGQALLRVQLTDKDSEANGGPFRLEVRGDGASAFTFDPQYNLITTRQLFYSEQKFFDLNVTAFDSGELSTNCPLKVYVKQQSRHPPVVKPYVIFINILNGEFNAGKLGQVQATDKDPGDMLRYALVESNNGVFKSNQINVNPTTGELSTQSSLLPGLHRFNISVTDGKYVSYAPVTIDVTDIDQEALDNSVTVKLSGVSSDEYIKSYMARVHNVFAQILDVPATYVRVLSVQAAEKRKTRREVSYTTVTTQLPSNEVDILLVVSRGENRGFHLPTFVKQKFTERIARFTAESGLEIKSITSEICRTDTCSKGKCRDRIWLDNVNFHQYQTNDNVIYYFPKFQRTFECLCRQGFSGRHCDIAINQCSRDDVCSKYQMCVPIDTQLTGMECVCPPGLKGPKCTDATCKVPSECSQKESISFLGDGFFQMFLSQSLEHKMELTVEFKTASLKAVLMHGAGLRDYHTLSVVDGYIEYVWNCGSGEGRVKIIQKKVNDGNWHTIKVARRRRQVQLMLDDKLGVSGASPGSSDVLNLFSNSMTLTFGAKVSNTDWNPFENHHNHLQSAADVNYKIEKGTVGCIGRVGLDGFDLPKNEQGLHLHNARIGCDTQVMGPCLSAPCLNNGQCVPKTDDNTYSCMCPQRYTGANCEIDLNACASNPCPKGIPCHNLYNDFHCTCPQGFTGKTCQLHGEWDPCITKPCGPFGTCQRQKASFICTCSDGFGGSFCSERVPSFLPDSLMIGSLQFYILIGMIVAAIVLAIIIIIICRRQNRNMVKSKHSDDSNLLQQDSAADPLIQAIPPTVAPVYRNASVERPPPRPPRQRGHNLPTVEVRPMQSLNSGYNHTPPPPPKHHRSNIYDQADEKPPVPEHHSSIKLTKKVPPPESDHSDYLTMKPVKRSPPTPPAHQKSSDMTKLYDNPNEATEK